MNQPVSIVIPSLFDVGLFERGLPPLLEELARRDSDDEVLVVDDTGEDRIGPWMTDHFPDVVVHARAENGGFGLALLDGVRAARHGLVFCMNPDIVVHPGFLEPLVSPMEDPEVHSTVPRILLHGEEDAIESVTEIRVRAGMGELGQPGLEGRASEFLEETIPVAYGVGGACLLRRDEFLARGGCDRIYEPFYFEDLDIGWYGWRSGQRVLYVPDSVVEHHHRGTIRKRVRERFVRAMIEKNRLLFQWKFLDTQEACAEHVAALYRTATDAWLADEREELVWLALALDQVEEVRESRAKLPPASRNWDEILRATSHPED